MAYPQFDRTSNHLPLDDQELQDFDDLLQALPVDGVMNLEGVDGFLTAMLLAPPAWLDTWPTADWLPQIWGGDGPDGQPFASGRQRKRGAKEDKNLLHGARRPLARLRASAAPLRH